MELLWKETTEGVDWEELAALYRAAPLGTKDAAALATAFSNSRFVVFVYEAGHLAGVGRALADGVDCSCICDVALLPSHQGCGLGKEIVQRLVERSRGHRKILLYAVPGKESFYARFGFRRMKTAMAIFQKPEEAQANGYIE